ncbi:MAG TPA: hypothetical protein VNT22_01555, partial [Baekduia sp.]|nr:hypothetical protein [Baekduia sp.]
MTTDAGVGELQEDQGFRWRSIPQTGAAPDPQSGVHILHRSRDGHYETCYQCWRDGVTERVSVAAEQEMFYIVEGTLACTYPSGASTQWRTGDLGYHSSGVPCEIVRSDGLRMVRFRWSAPPAQRTADVGLHVFGDRGPTTLYHGAPVTNHTVHESSDGRVLGFYGVATEGVRFTEVPQDVEESFLVVQGSIRCTPH